MKKILSILILSLSLSACASSSLPRDIAKKDPELKEIAKLWDSVAKSLESENCDAFKKHLRDSMQKMNCDEVFESVKAQGVPVINWEKVQWNSSKTAIKLWEKDSVPSLTTLRQMSENDKKVWKIERRFW